MTATGRSAQDLLLYLRTRCPALARRFDGVAGIEVSGSTLVVAVAEGSWWHAELAARAGLLGRLASDCLGAPTALALDSRPGDPGALPLPVAATKLWNHVAFWAGEGDEAAVVAVRKTRYAERWVPLADAQPEALAAELAAPEVFACGYRAPAPLPPAETPSTWLLPETLGDLCRLARAEASYAQLVVPFPGDDAADRLEARLYAVKEWGTPEVPGPIFQKYVGRLHYVAPGGRAVGVRAAELALAQGRG
ncbi:MAG: hypothetical protein HZB55_11585 [Deltaproteobacteria bacterium]|nr:hypothetical protein [Deltaproteobacteria bacterium]